MSREPKHYFKKHKYNNGKSAVPRGDSAVIGELIMKGFLKEVIFLAEFLNSEFIVERKKARYFRFKNGIQTSFKNHQAKTVLKNSKIINDLLQYPFTLKSVKYSG